MARSLASQIAVMRIEANIAIAANPDTAMHAARGFNGITLIPPGQEEQRLGILPLQCCWIPSKYLNRRELPVALSNVSGRNYVEQMLDTLERWGVRDFRALALLPEHALASRLGETGARLQRLARGAETAHAGAVRAGIAF